MEKGEDSTMANSTINTTTNTTFELESSAASDATIGFDTTFGSATDFGELFQEFIFIIFHIFFNFVSYVLLAK